MAERRVEWVERTTVLIAPSPRQAPRLDLPPMNRFTERDGLLLARVAPHQVYAMRLGADRPLMAELQAVTGGAGLIDLSDARVGIRIAGPDARDRLARLVPLDLHPSRFMPGLCAATVMAHLNVLLLQLGPDSFEVQCGRSFADSLARAVR
ncbi:MAG: sarcosine oxidase subunit gamma [Janthinobacterium lividum]